MLIRKADMAACRKNRRPPLRGKPSGMLRHRLKSTAPPDTADAGRAGNYSPSILAPM